MKKVLVGICLLVMLIPFASAMADDNLSFVSGGSEASPYIVGAWKLICDPAVTTSCSPILDTEFRFINPTPLNVTLEYAFFENNGHFCGCDRDTFAPNKTTVYTASGERNASPTNMACSGTSGALKSIVFVGQNDGIILIQGAKQTGFQTHLFGGITSFANAFDTANTASTNYANTMAEAGMKAIPITPATLAEINLIHQNCVKFLGH